MISTLATLALLAAAPPSAAALRADGLAAYKARRYAEACTLWEKAAKADPEDGATLADLGLCYQKLGKPEAAVKASYEAVRKGDAQTRRNAYYNLYTLGVKVNVTRGKACDELKVPGCGRALTACAFDWSQYGSGGGSYGTGVRIAASASSAEREEDSGRPADVEDLPTVAPPPGRVAVVDLLLDETSEDFCRGCDEEAAAERKRCAERCAQARISPVERCTIVVADACLGVVGVVCKRSGVAKPEVGEVEMDTALEQE